MILRLFIAVAGMLALLLVGPLCHARPPENADPELAPWFRSLRTANGGLCCSQADCRPAEYRISGDHYEVLIGKQYGDDGSPHWEVVAAESVLSKTDNPNGRAIACWLPYANPRVLCFVRPAET